METLVSVVKIAIICRSVWVLIIIVKNFWELTDEKNMPIEVRFLEEKVLDIVTKKNLKENGGLYLLITSQVLFVVAIAVGKYSPWWYVVPTTLITGMLLIHWKRSQLRKRLNPICEHCSAEAAHTGTCTTCGKSGCKNCLGTAYGLHAGESTKWHTGCPLPEGYSQEESEGKPYTSPAPPYWNQRDLR